MTLLIATYVCLIERIFALHTHTHTHVHVKRFHLQLYMCVHAGTHTPCTDMCFRHKMRVKYVVRQKLCVCVCACACVCARARVCVVAHVRTERSWYIKGFSYKTRSFKVSDLFSLSLSLCVCVCVCTFCAERH